MISRRDFVKGGVALVSIGTTAQSLLKGAVAFAAQNSAYVADPNNKKTLIIVQLAGGNDGINTLVPASDPVYRSSRKTIGLPEDQVLPLAEGFSLHPALTGLKGLWDDGKLAVVRGVGYPNQNYSHFKSSAIWQAGDPEMNLDNGWLGRTLEQMESQQHDPFLGFNVGNSTPDEMRTPKIAIPSVTDEADYGVKVAGKLVPTTEARTATMLKLYEQYPSNSPYGVLLETTADSAVSSSKMLQDAAKTYKPAVEYPQTSFAAGLSLLAEAITSDLGVRVGHATLGGFDTHNNELAEHQERMETLDGGLTAFYQDLQAHGKADDVVVLTWSEFGRRVAENANGGTDHGAASVCFALGNGVQKGLYGDAPNLAALIDNGNVPYTTDFRRVYATVIERWLGVPSEALLGQRWDPLGFLAA
ncbi:MAG TPA: DUF1501 domain-containing protein [Tepidiformaceae bacterium]|nr:DUF1501 domain-containing protein [Tepidiformaceae bacterium]